MRAPSFSAFSWRIGALGALVLASAAVVTRHVADADSAPPTPDPTNPVTVSADALPTVQINGVVWSQVTVGNTVYVAGSFTRARPAGSPAGTNEVVRNNILAYDIRTGVLIDAFAPSLNAQALALAASPNGQRIYVGGDFTQVNGQTRNRVAALNLDGSLVAGWAPNVSSQVRAIASTADTVYLGGALTAVGSAPRDRLAAVSAATGALLPWAPVPGVGPTDGNRDGNTATSNVVMSLVITGGGSQVVASGRFDTMNGVKATGVAALDPVTGANRPFAINQLITNQGINSAIYSLSTDGTTVFGSGYDYRGPGNVEGTFAAAADGGALLSINDCRGDSYSTYPMNGVLYVASHTHNCWSIGGVIEQNPRVEKRATAYTIAPVTKVRWGTNVNWVNKPAGAQLAWNPTLDAGSFTGQLQASWSVTGNGEYVSYGGEFPRVNGVAQQGIVRFALPTAGGNPNRVGPTYGGFTASVAMSAPGTARISWPETWDMDNEFLTYRVFRDSDTAPPIYTATRPSRWFNLDWMGYSDTNQSGSHRYRVTATDPFGNFAATPWVTVTSPTGTASPRPYVSAVQADGALDLWSLNEGSGSAFSAISGNDLTVGASAVRGAPGAIFGDSDGAITFNGTSGASAASQRLVQSSDNLTVEAWFRTTSTAGGKIVGFGNTNTGASTTFDRHIYMDGAGRVFFGVTELNQRRTIQSRTGLNDGAYHHVVATLGPTGMQLFIDGVRASSRTDITFGPNYYGYWRVGGDATWAGAQNFTGQIDEVAIYPFVLSSAQVTNHYVLGTSGVPNTPPVASFTSSVAALTASVDASASSDPDGSIVSYAWNFGDGSTGTGMTATRAYPNAGTYTVVLTVTDNRGATATTTRSVTVTNPPNQQPTAAFTHAVTDLTVAVDAGSSSDPDGSIVSYAWNFGDGATGSGVTASRTYIAAGSYTVQLIVTDNRGVTAITSRVVTVSDPPPNDPPVAAFTYSVADSMANLDASSSSDPDGTIVSYAWDFGDGATGTGVTASRTYAAAGTYTVQLTVTDNRGATVTTSNAVTVNEPVNVSPTAAFTHSVVGLRVDVNGTGSFDPDGSIVSYAWDFGDGTTGTGATASRTYAAAGTYSVQLTVTDDRGGTASISRSVTVTAGPVVLAADAFERTVAAGSLGTADVGGLWTVAQGGSRQSVSGGAAQLTLPAAGNNSGSFLGSVSATAVDVTTSFSLSSTPTGNGTYLYVTGRRVGTNEYRLRVRVLADGRVALAVSVVAGTESFPGGEAIVPGLTYAPNSVMNVRVQVTGANPTTVTGKVWAAGTAEPANPQTTVTSTTAALQAAGGVGLMAHRPSGTTAATTVRVTDFAVTAA